MCGIVRGGIAGEMWSWIMWPDRLYLMMVWPVIVHQGIMYPELDKARGVVIMGSVAGFMGPEVV